jgi:hypothetical protein
LPRLRFCLKILRISRRISPDNVPRAGAFFGRNEA